MFFIVNKTKGPITLGDIGVSLGPRQAVDLDKIMKRSKSDQSQSLKSANAKGDIEIRVKDVKKSNDTIDIKVKSNSSNDLKSMKEEIVGEVKEAVKELLNSQTKGISKEDLYGITQNLIDAMPKMKGTVIYRHGSENVRQDEEVDMDEEVMSEINKRAVNKIVKNAKSVDVRYEQESKKDDIMKNINELENLLG